MGGKNRKWKLWRNSSGEAGSSWKGFKGNHKAAFECSDSPRNTEAYTAAVATVVRAHPRDLRVVRKWTFGEKGVDGVERHCEDSTAGSGKTSEEAGGCDAEVHASSSASSSTREGASCASIEGQAVQNMLNERRTQAEEGWCDSKGTIDDIKEKIQMRQEGAFKRERAIAYALAQKQCRSTPGSRRIQC